MKKWIVICAVATGLLTANSAASAIIEYRYIGGDLYLDDQSAGLEGTMGDVIDGHDVTITVNTDYVTDHSILWLNSGDSTYDGTGFPYPDSVVNFTWEGWEVDTQPIPFYVSIFFDDQWRVRYANIGILWDNYIPHTIGATDVFTYINTVTGYTNIYESTSRGVWRTVSIDGVAVPIPAPAPMLLGGLIVLGLSSRKKV
jgi:hypothetical protein